MPKKIRERDKILEKQIKYLDRDEELELTSKAKGGDKESWGTLYEHFLGAVTGRINGRIGNEEDAKDLAQEVFITAEENLRGCKYDPEYSFYKFLCNITEWVIGDYWEMKAGRPSRISGTVAAYDARAGVLRLKIRGNKIIECPIADRTKIKKEIKEGDKITVYHRQVGGERIVIRITVLKHIPSSKEEKRRKTKEEGGEMKLPETEDRGEQAESQFKEAAYGKKEIFFSDLAPPGKDNEPLDFPDPITKTPAEEIDDPVILEYLNLVFLCCGKPHQVLAFGFREVFDWAPERMAEEFDNLSLRKIKDKFYDALYPEVGETTDQPTFDNCFFPLQEKLEKGVKEVYTEHEYKNLREKYGNRQVKDLPFQAFYQTRQPPESLSDWANKVQNRARDVVKLGKYCGDESARR